MTAEALWQCKPEFSTVKMVGDNKVLSVRCRCECDSGFELKSTARDCEICHTCEDVQDCPGGRACLPMSCVDKINGYSCSRHPGYDERSSAKCVCDCNRKSCGVPVDIDKVDHVPLNAIKLEEPVTYECHVQSQFRDG